MPLTKLNSASVIERLPVGSVLQTKKTQYISTTSVAVAATTNTAINVLSVNITPTSVNSIIRLDTHIFHEWAGVNNAHDSVWFFYRDTTKLAIAQNGNNNCGISMSLTSFQQDGDSTAEVANYSYFDSPNTTSQITYKVGVITQTASNVFINTCVNQGTAIDYDRGLSFISAQEIKQ